MIELDKLMAPPERRKGITVQVIIEVAEGADAEAEAAAIGGKLVGYLERELEGRLRIDSWVSPCAHTWDNPDHGGDMIRYDQNPRGV